MSATRDYNRLADHGPRDVDAPATLLAEALWRTAGQPFVTSAADLTLLTDALGGDQDDLMRARSRLLARPRTCSRCGKDKPRSDFYREYRKPGRRYARCKSCHQRANSAAEKIREGRTRRGDAPSAPTTAAGNQKENVS